MPAYLSNELGGFANRIAVPTGHKPTATVYGGRLKRLRASFNVALQTTSDTLVIGDLPAGATFAYGVLNSNLSLGSSTLAIGTSNNTNKYRRAATFTDTDTPTVFGNMAPVVADPLAATERVIGTIAVAAFPANGTLVVDLYYSQPN